MNYSTEKKIAIFAVKQASKTAIKFFNKIDQIKTHKKSQHEIVTPADLAVNKIIKKHIYQKFPTYGILSEETGAEKINSEYFWVIDPIDGTTNFSLGNPFFNISLALVHNKKIVLGIIYAPILNQLFVAEKGKGVTLNNKKIKVSTEKNLSDAIIDFGYSYRNHVNTKFSKLYINLMKGIEHTRNMGAAALELAWVAMGRLEGYILFDVKLWDVAAGALMVQEAGGKITDFDNQSFNIDSKTLLATNKKVHQPVLKIIDKS